MDPKRLICDIGELNHLFKNSISIEHFLEQTVAMVSKHLHCDVCSIYIYDEDDNELTLKATIGLNPRAKENVRLSLGEGLVGKAIKELRAINIEDAIHHPDFKNFQGIGEEKFKNFLAVPIARGVNRIGVMSLQRVSSKKFADEDETACMAVASQLANIIENAKFLISLHASPDAKTKKLKQEKFEDLHVSVASRGFALSSIIVVDKDKTFKNLLHRSFDRQYSLEQFQAAVLRTQHQLENLQNQVEEKLSDAASLIFASHLLILKDKEFIGAMVELIEKSFNPPDAIMRIAKRYVDIFSSSENQYVREKVQDLEDLTVRLIGNLESSLEEMAAVQKKIVIARDLFPSDLLKFSSEDIAGIILVSGGVTSHIAILARSLAIPMVIIAEPRLMNLGTENVVLLDADEGTIYVNPSEDVKKQYETHSSSRQILQQQKKTVRSETFTSDGQQITLLANVNLFTDAKLANELKCQGVGLYRSEFPFIIRNNFPTEQEQYVTYLNLIEIMNGKPLLFRTLDIGGDKVLSYYQTAHEQNPFLGMRSIRFCLQNKDVFVGQIRAILRAGVNAELGIMFPMISSIDEFIAAKQIVLECMDDLKQARIQYNENPQIGMMIELPSVVDLIDDFAELADFFSIGTNDFIQFMLGVDRTNENVADLYLPYHPAVLRAINKVTGSALKHGIGISICGDMAHNPEYIPILIGMGIRKFSLDAAYIPPIQDHIEKLSLGRTQEMTMEILECSRVQQVREILDRIKNDE